MPIENTHEFTITMTQAEVDEAKARLFPFIADNYQYVTEYEDCPNPLIPEAELGLIMAAFHVLSNNLPLRADEIMQWAASYHDGGGQTFTTWFISDYLDTGGIAQVCEHMGVENLRGLIDRHCLRKSVWAELDGSNDPAWQACKAKIASLNDHEDDDDLRFEFLRVVRRKMDAIVEARMKQAA